MRLVLITTGLAVAGAENQVFQLATCLKQRGWEPVIISLIPPRAWVRDLEELGIPVISLGMKGVQSVPRAWVQLIGFLRYFRPDVVHAHMFHANLLARLARLVALVPVLVCTAHSTYEAPAQASQPRERTWREWAYRLTDPLCDLTTQVSQSGLERYVKVKAVPRKKIRVVPNGVDTDCFRPDPGTRRELRKELGWEHRFVWISVGRFEAPKNHRTLIEALALLEQETGLLVLIGDGNMRNEIEELTFTLGITSRVCFLGVRKDIPQLMNAADAYVMSSRWEGLPMSLLEAQACGLPVVATNVGGVPEIVRNGITGVLTPAGNPLALASAMRTLMEASPASRKAMGLAARQRVLNQFSLEQVVSQWENLFSEIITKQGTKPKRTVR